MYKAKVKVVYDIRKQTFIVDRPFGFVVYDYNQDVPLFVGKVI